ncbi:dipeptidyl peptidase 2 [Ascaphus truei]|uniref:dipeptidyl peptidase 2 n=1 Tax=Ascaphus truei TaxID=8439 RepID=UPI003F596CE8
MNRGSSQQLLLPTLLLLVVSSSTGVESQAWAPSSTPPIYAAAPPPFSLAILYPPTWSPPMSNQIPAPPSTLATIYITMVTNPRPPISQIITPPPITPPPMTLPPMTLPPMTQHTGFRESEGLKVSILKLTAKTSGAEKAYQNPSEVAPLRRPLTLEDMAENPFPAPPPGATYPPIGAELPLNPISDGGASAQFPAPPPGATYPPIGAELPLNPILDGGVSAQFPAPPPWATYPPIGAELRLNPISGGGVSAQFPDPPIGAELRLNPISGGGVSAQFPAPPPGATYPPIIAELRLNPISDGGVSAQFPGIVEPFTPAPPLLVNTPRKPWGFFHVASTPERPSKSEPSFEEKFFKQLIDHFSFSSHGSKTFFHRYLITAQYWNKGVGPLFFYTGGRHDIWKSMEESGFIIELADDQDALVVFAEHRYYGNSLPFGNMSFERENIGMLSIEQVLADYVMLIKNIKHEYKAGRSPVVAFGGGYAGMLSAYIRLKYPNMICCALASSSPLYSAAGTGDAYKFFGDVTASYQSSSAECVEAVRDAFNQIKNMFLGQDFRSITFRMRMCENLQHKDDIYLLYKFVRNALTAIAVMNYPFKTDKMGFWSPYSIKTACERLLLNADRIEGLRDAIGIYYNATGTTACYSLHNQFMQCSDPTGCGIGSDAIAWDYQTCTEIAFMFSSNNITDMFPAIPFTDTVREHYCFNRWQVRSRLDWLKTEFGGTDLKTGSNIIFSNGALDPWANCGVKNNLSSTLIGINILGAAQQLDLRSHNPVDSEAVRNARNLEADIIFRWVKQTKVENAWEKLVGMFGGNPQNKQPPNL